MIEKIKCRNCNNQVAYASEYCSCGSSTDFSKLTESRRKELGFKYFWKNMLFPFLGIIMWISIVLAAVALFGSVFILNFTFFIPNTGAGWAIITFGLIALAAGIANKILFEVFFNKWLKANKGY